MAKAFHFFKWTGKKAVVLLVLSIVLTTALVGATVAFIIDITQSLTNTFEPANIDITISGDTISNTGDADVYVRAAVVVAAVVAALKAKPLPIPTGNNCDGACGHGYDSRCAGRA